MPSDDEPKFASSAHAQLSPLRERLSKMLGRWIEILVLGLVVVSPWLFGGVEPTQEWWLFSGVSLGLVLWALRVLLNGRLSWHPCRVVMCVLGLVYLGFWQLLPMPPNVVAVLSPATERTLTFLQPEKEESLRLEETSFSAQKQSTHSLSFYRAGTAQAICRILAALSLFALVRNNIPAKKGLFHLSLVAVINGVALSLLGIFQLFSSPPNEIYWSYPAPAVIFGPFICRNHFPFYVNCCIGLGLGLLVYSQSSQSDSERSERNGHGSGHRSRHRSRSSRERDGAEEKSTFIRVETLWLGVGLALMVCAVLLSLSRGGVVVLFATALLGFIFWGRSLLRLSRLTTGLVVGAAGVFGLLSWLGFNLVKDRLETLWQTGGLEARTPLWSSCLPLLGQFPIFGTGYGTFQLVEPIYRPYISEEFSQVTFVHAHNEFIEAMVEGGVFRLLLTVAAIGFVFIAGYRVLRRSGSSSGLVAGALFAFTTLVLHSMGDFGMHVPAITILAAVLAALIMGVADESAERHALRRGKTAPAVWNIRWGGIAPWLAASVFASVALLLFAQSYHWQIVHRYMLAGLNRGANDNADQQERRIEFLKKATALDPGYATTEIELAQAYYEAYGSQEVRLGDLEDTDDLVNAILAWRVWDGSPASLVSIAATTTPAVLRWQSYIAKRDAEFDRNYLSPALRYFIVARDLCPLMGKPHARLAAHRDLLAKGDMSEQYMERVRFLRQYDPEVWYISGILDLTSGRPAEAWKSWKRSLELSDSFSSEIAHRSLRFLTMNEFINTVLPDKPAQIYRIANELYPVPATEEKRKKPLIDRAMELLGGPDRVLTWEESRLKAHLYVELGEYSKAIDAFKFAILMNPKSDDLRVEYATLLHQRQLGQLARLELLAILNRNPGHTKARELLANIDRETNR